MEKQDSQFHSDDQDANNPHFESELGLKLDSDHIQSPKQGPIQSSTPQATSPVAEVDHDAFGAVPTPSSPISPSAFADVPVGQTASATVCTMHYVQSEETLSHFTV